MTYNKMYKLLRTYGIPKPVIIKFLDGAHGGIAQTVRLDQDKYMLTWNKTDGFTLNPVQEIK